MTSVGRSRWRCDVRRWSRLRAPFDHRNNVAGGRVVEYTVRIARIGARFQRWLRGIACSEHAVVISQGSGGGRWKGEGGLSGLSQRPPHSRRTRRPSCPSLSARLPRLARGTRKAVST